MINLLKKFVKIFRMAESALLVFFLALIVIISFSQIILRNFFTSITWFDSLLKYSVLWAGMIAAAIATYDNKHIKIDIIGRFTKGRLKIIAEAITNVFAFIVCFGLFIGFIIYIATIEYPSTDEPPFLNIHRWELLLVLPVSFFVMSIRFLIHSIKNMLDAKNFENQKTEPESKGEK
jgi:TRAP-type C4-dicarboxylate transport system permease small subunit